MLRSTIILLVSVCFIASGHAAPADVPTAKKRKAASASSWVVKTYRFYDGMDIETKTQGHLVAPKAPDSKASEKEVTEFIKKSHLVSNAYFGQTGYTPPPGSLFIFDPKSFTLVARTTESFHILINVLAEHFSKEKPCILNCSLEILETDSAILLEELKAMAPIIDHSPALDRLAALADQGKAKRISSASMQARSGQRVKIDSTTGHNFASGFTVEQNGDTSTDLDRYESGTKLELDPVLGEDHKTIDFNFALDHDFTPPTDRWARSSARLSNRSVESQVTDLHNVDLNSAVTMLSGQTRLLGIWKPETSGNNADHPDVLQAGFLRIDALELGPLENEQLPKWMTSIGEKVIPTPKEAPPEPEGVPNGMTIRLIPVPPEFFEKVQGGSSADPFAGPAPNPATGAGAGASPGIPQSAKNEPRFTTKSTVMEILRSLGANFPEGSSATYDEKHGLLVVRNTPENLRFLEPMELRSSGTKLFSLTAHIVQADGATIRKLQQDARLITDHSKVWETLEETVGKQQATIVRSAWIGTRSGQRSRAEFGDEMASVNAFWTEQASADSERSPKAETTAEPSTKPNEPKQPPPSSSVANASIKTAAARAIEGTHETERVGTSLEIDPVIGEDGRTIDLNLAMAYDYAPPTEKTTAEEPPAKTLRTEVNGHDFHRVNVNQVTTMETGTWRLFSVWKPHGTAEFDGKDILQALFIKADIVEVKARE